MTKIDLAKLILADESDFSVYMLAQPTRGPLRNRELTRDELIVQFAKSHTTRELEAWVRVAGK